MSCVCVDRMNWKYELLWPVHVDYASADTHTHTLTHSLILFEDNYQAGLKVDNAGTAVTAEITQSRNCRHNRDKM